MNTTPNPSAPASALVSELVGLNATDTARITEPIAANYASNTLHAYACAWSHWTAWCAGRDLDPAHEGVRQVGQFRAGRPFALVERGVSSHIRLLRRCNTQT